MLLWGFREALFRLMHTKALAARKCRGKCGRDGAEKAPAINSRPSTERCRNHGRGTETGPSAALLAHLWTQMGIQFYLEPREGPLLARRRLWQAREDIRLLVPEAETTVAQRTMLRSMVARTRSHIRGKHRPQQNINSSATRKMLPGELLTCVLGACFLAFC